ncbi:hypothetical protein A3A54_01080 [Candidatus Curtissbacteria bacterium RIFCSPLOWO2_01_FULL_39_62]|uniref:7 transmembrane helices usually fused to an inactive transglutaminase domain-containing protein n=2 Tax=Candidatus Curtissiibacteriota TaxID=1752717 RepID=A0A1F5GAI0_9BACT|nr:MAG: hypothetical protein A2775_01690 [Candidatus Curtissbacteria bacterium RIFCSPHIGHO2_01_FULL_39_57]OGD88892.1 MAG: hypothetical protein A3D04_03780 [Candidatus Curtissbacteria bacterium RIFCSPHIGHO2_02_FULL_40_16b]OGD91044.1 MAG: hypothetical protein A3E11_00210 [Candidatus Curtissbacteria bacterium RIFCSPHIGHO2_12_FULL_38_37]OGD99378.1 MAG: hypothetical protein A3J17_02410 [Candidatus Curtissbacteria bacterium RIFCSPLOWO2_02_FULL_40_11]OGE01408.1 MAG: hypothetical protein A3A54_01080 [C
MSKAIGISIFALILMALSATPVYSQIPTRSPSASAVGISVESDSIAEETSQESTQSGEKEEIKKLKKEDITQPEEEEKKSEILDLFANRPISNLSPLNFIAFTVQYAVGVGVPANTIVLILLLPFLATIVAFTRHVVGLPSLDILVPIALSITIVSTGIIAGSILLIAILLASSIGRFVLRKVRIMQLPKKALSILIVAVFVFLALVVSAANGILIVKQLSIFPILILILLGEKIISLQLTRSFSETLTITAVTISIGIFGFWILSTKMFTQAILLYPEITLLLLPVNYAIGRYFGLRLTEIYRFSYIKKHAS